MNASQKILKKGLILGHYQKKKDIKVNYRRIRLKNHERISETKSNTCSYLTDDNDESKKTKGTKKTWNQKNT